MEEGKTLSRDVPHATKITEEFSSKLPDFNPTASKTSASACKGDLTATLQDDEDSENEYCSAEEDMEPDEPECSTSAYKLVNSDSILFDAKNDDISSASALTKKLNQKQSQNDMAIQVPIDDFQVMIDKENSLPVKTKMLSTTQVPLSHATSARDSSKEVPLIPTPLLTAPELPKKRKETDNYNSAIQAQLEELERMNDREGDTPMILQREFSAMTKKMPSASVPLPHLPSKHESTKLPTIPLVPFEAASLEPITTTTASSKFVPWASPSVVAPVEAQMLPTTQVPLSLATSARESSEEIPLIPTPFLPAPELPRKQNEHDHYYSAIQAQLEELKLMNDNESDTPTILQMDISTNGIKLLSASVTLHELSEHESTEPLPMLVPFSDATWETITSTTESLESLPLPSESSTTVPSASPAPTTPLVHDVLLQEALRPSVLGQGSEEQEMHLVLYQQNTAFGLYCQHLQNVLEDDSLPNNVEELHEMNFERAMQSYEACTRGLGNHAVDVGREILIENVEKYLKQLREDAQNRMAVFKTSMSDQMSNIYSEMILHFQLKFAEIAYDTEEMKKLEETYAIAMDETLNTFDLITTDMQEDTNIPRRLLLSEMNSCYKNSKTEMCTKLLTKAEHNAMHSFKLIYTTQRDTCTGDLCKSMLEDIAQSALTAALTGFEKDISDLNSTIVNQFRCRLKKDLKSACSKAIESHVVEERSRIFQSHQRNLANPDLTTQENLLLQYSEALADSISSFRQRTIGFPTHLVNAECFFLQQDMEHELNDRLLHIMQLLETKKLNAAKSEARDMYAVVFEIDQNSVGDEEPGTLAMELSALREKHEEALGVAFASFDRLTFEVDSRIAEIARKEIQEEFGLKLNNILKQTEDRVNVSQFELAATEARSLYMSIFSGENLENVSYEYHTNITSADDNVDSSTEELFSIDFELYTEYSHRDEIYEDPNVPESHPESFIDTSESNAAAPANATEDVLNQLENRHIAAFTSALNLFDQLTADLRGTDTTLRRAQLIESLENVYHEAMTHQRNQQLDMAENRALEKFTADLNVAARDSDTWTRRKEEARENALQQFDEDISYFGSAAALHRERLQRAMDSSLHVIQSVCETFGGDRECCVCLTELCNTAFQPCGHRSCSTCAPRLSECPTCRCVIEGTLRIY